MRMFGKRESRAPLPALWARALGPRKARVHASLAIMWQCKLSEAVLMPSAYGSAPTSVVRLIDAALHGRCPFHPSNNINNWNVNRTTVYSLAAPAPLRAAQLETVRRVAAALRSRGNVYYQLVNVPNHSQPAWGLPVREVLRATDPAKLCALASLHPLPPPHTPQAHSPPPLKPATSP